MADFFSSSYAQTVSNVGATVAKLGDNAKKNSATPLSNFGTPILRAIRISVADANASTTPTASDSVLSQIISQVQSKAEIYYVGAFTNANPSVGLMLVTDHSANDGSNASPSLSDGSYGSLEAAIVANVTGASACTITTVTATGATFS